MRKGLTRSLLILSCTLLCMMFTPSLYAQRERQIGGTDASSSSSDDGGDFGSRFFSQLNSIFGKFRDSELQRVFQTAEPIHCSELISGKGEWREVAFFNENRKLGDWYRSNIEEVRNDLSVYLFKGTCSSVFGTVQITTKFPVEESSDRYDEGKIPFDQIDVNVNRPVNAVFDSRTGAYSFDLPYLYLTSHQGSNNTYSLVPPHYDDKYARDVTNLWDCKAVKSADITYRFMICRTSVASRGLSRNQTSTPAFGSSAYFILSDGTEARSSVTLTFGDSDQPAVSSATSSTNSTKPTGGTGVSGWQTPAYKSQVMHVDMSEFRIRFNAQTWKDRIGTSQVIYDQNVASLLAAKPADGADYCTWTPGTPDLLSRLLSEEPDKDVAYSIQGIDRGAGQSTSSIVVVMKTHTGARLGAIQCYFPKTESADVVGYDRWSAIVGSQLKLEVRSDK